MIGKDYSTADLYGGSSFASSSMKWQAIRTQYSAVGGYQSPGHSRANQLDTEPKTEKYDPERRRLEERHRVGDENLGLPNASGIKFRWIHVPANNMVYST